MPEHLLQVTLGPIQDFIAAARRTRDLWFGSHLLSELSRAAAAALANHGQLVFPALDAGDLELVPCDQVVRPGTDRMPLSVANKLVVVLPAGTDPRQAAQAARRAAQQRLVDLATKARRAADGLLAADHDIAAIWDEQLATALEFCAGWAPLDGGYATVREQVEAALASRKNLREFVPWQHSRCGAPKSSLDGARETVLAEPAQRAPAKVQRYRIASTEQLDAIGVLKRCGGDPEQFVPIRSVALASWLERNTARLGPVEDACKQCGQLTKVRTLSGGRFFNYDADVFFPDRWAAIERELSPDGLPLTGWSAVKEAAGGVLRERTVPEPYPYVACLVADGDHMGAALNRLSSAEAHREFSRRLAAFPDQAREVVEKHLGALVYAGGDDVLAFLPLTKAVECADALRRKFHELLGDLNPAQPPTLSVGLGIGHSLEAMGDLLDLGRRAEKLAKVARNSLAVVVQKRSGGEDSWTARWSGGPPDHGALADAVKCQGSSLPAKKVAQVRDLLRRAPRPTEPDSGSWCDVLTQEVRRIIAHTAGGVQPPPLAEVRLELPTTGSYAGLHRAVDNWVGLQRVAMVLAAANRAIGEG
ncbi:MAG: type III-B CRISPR-associated protein Cas10/Cmr2 [Fimbriimonadaceae bacterium]|nr:type III-B CRISPR-associated protein Cas10/Cmr2 [Fimbriimonadaceae bacterium]